MATLHQYTNLCVSHRGRSKSQSIWLWILSPFDFPGCYTGSGRLFWYLALQACIELNQRRWKLHWVTRILDAGKGFTAYSSSSGKCLLIQADLLSGHLFRHTKKGKQFCSANKHLQKNISVFILDCTKLHYSSDLLISSKVA